MLRGTHWCFHRGHAGAPAPAHALRMRPASLALRYARWRKRIGLAWRACAARARPAACHAKRKSGHARPAQSRSPAHRYAFARPRPQGRRFRAVAPPCTPGPLPPRGEGAAAPRTGAPAPPRARWPTGMPPAACVPWAGPWAGFLLTARPFMEPAPLPVCKLPCTEPALPRVLSALPRAPPIARPSPMPCALPAPPRASPMPRSLPAPPRPAVPGTPYPALPRRVASPGGTRQLPP